MTGQLRSNRKTSDEPSLGMSFGVLCVVLFAMVAIIINIHVPDIQLAPADFGL